MKHLLLFTVLAASLGANAYLLISNPAASSAGNASRSGTSAKAVMADGAKPPALPPDIWALVQAGDTASADRLRALGLPEHVVRALIRAEVNARYLEREKALYAGNESNYWERAFSTYRFRANDAAAALDLTREKEAELKRLLGPSPADENPWARDTLAFLPADKREQLKLIEEDYRAMQTRNDQYSMIRLPEDREKQRYLETQKRTDLEAILTPEELEQYDLRNSSTAQQLRWQLAGFDMNEDEYKTVFALQKPFDDKYRADRGSSRSPEDMRARSDAQKVLEADIKAALGEQRFAEYKRAQDQDYKLLRQLNTRLEVPTEKINQAYDLKLALEKKVREFKPTPGADRNKQRADFQAALALEAETSYKNLLGEKAYAAVSDQIMRRLRPNTPDTPTTTTTTTRVITSP
jgi:hypothetical protein